MKRYFCRMEQQCKKCGIVYEPRRRGGKYCSVSCRVTAHQRAQRRGGWTNPNARHEAYLAQKLVAVARSCRETLAEVEGMSDAAARATLWQLVRAWSETDNNYIIEAILRNEQGPPNRKTNVIIPASRKSQA